MIEAAISTKQPIQERYAPLMAFGLTALLVIGVAIGRGSMLGLDGFFHIRMADLYATGAISDAGANFHWTQHSLWNGHFADKDFLWHILLIPLVWIFGNDPGSLEVAAVCGAALASGGVAATLTRILQLRDVRFSLLWALVLLGASTTLVYRLGLPRSYLLSMTAALLGWHWIDRRRWKCLAGLAVVYTLSYTAPHLLLVLASIWAFVTFISEVKKGTRWLSALKLLWLPFVAVLLGITIGALLHPHTENLLRLWVVQNLLVPAHAAGLSDFANSLGAMVGFAIPEGVSVTRDIGLEMAPLGVGELFYAEWGALVLLVGPWFYALIRRVKPRAEDSFAWICAAMFFAMMLNSERFAEYFYPFAVLAAALLVSRVNREAASPSKRWGKLLQEFPKWALVILVVAMVARPAFLVPKLRARSISIGDAVLAIQDKVPEGEAIFHTDWGDFTQLFFVMPERDYVVGLDPTFFFVANPELYASYQRLRAGDTAAFGKGRTAATIIREDFGMRYVLVRNAARNLATKLQREAMRSKRVKVLARDDNAGWWLFAIDEPTTK